MTLRLDGQVAIVTGSGGGLGRAYAHSLAARGAAVVVHDVKQTDGRRAVDVVVDEIVAAGGTAIACHEDIAAPPGPQRIVDAALAAFGRIDILVNNAGIARMTGFENQSRADVEAILATHVLGSFMLSQAAYVPMRAAGYGRILFVSSSGATFGMPNATGYAAAKGGLLGLMKVLALEGAPHGVRCNALLPGAFTPMAPRISGTAPPGFERLYDACARVDARFTPEFVAPMVDYLVSPACTATGEIYAAQAGEFARVVMVKSRGWTAPGDDLPTAEDIEQHFAAIHDCSRWFEPIDAIDDLIATGDALERR